MNWRDPAPIGSHLLCHRLGAQCIAWLVKEANYLVGQEAPPRPDEKQCPSLYDEAVNYPHLDKLRPKMQLNE